VTWRRQIFDMADRMSVSEAAEALDITRNAVYKRVERNKIRHEKDADGQLYVYVEKSDTSQRQNVKSESSTLTSALEARIDSLERQLEAEREANRENRRLLAAALDRIPPQLEAPSEPRESPETAPVEEAEQHSRDVQDGARRPWWRRWFGG
jgi:excisionase family DNA binding protein